jgi:molecular chaperone GrpE
VAREAEQNAAEGDGAVDQQDRDAVARLEAEVAALRDQLLRALADQENVRRRAARERDDAVRFAAAAVIKDLLPTADSIRRAIESIPEQADQDELIRTLLAGVAATEKAMLDALARHGIQRIEPAPGEPFDPRRHHAMMEIEDPAARPGTVKEVLQSGYAYHDRLLRPALVGVARGGAGAAEQGGGTAGRSNDRERPSEGADNGEV